MTNIYLPFILSSKVPGGLTSGNCQRLSTWKIVSHLLLTCSWVQSFYFPNRGRDLKCKCSLVWELIDPSSHEGVDVWSSRRSSQTWKNARHSCRRNGTDTRASRPTSWINHFWRQGQGTFHSDTRPAPLLLWCTAGLGHCCLWAPTVCSQCFTLVMATVPGFCSRKLLVSSQITL